MQAVALKLTYGWTQTHLLMCVGMWDHTGLSRWLPIPFLYVTAILVRIDCDHGHAHTNKHISKCRNIRVPSGPVHIYEGRRTIVTHKVPLNGLD